MLFFKDQPLCLLAAGAIFCFITGCKSTAGSSRQNLIDDTTYRLTEVSDDKSYGFIVENPIIAGNGNEFDGPKNELRYLNALTGPEGEQVYFNKAGVCCNFKTSNVKPSGIGRLSKFKVYYQGLPDTVTLYINKYDNGKMKAPAGFGFKK